jgi:heterodisulfide reductase subunit A-like polyferredoxin
MSETRGTTFDEAGSGKTGAVMVVGGGIAAMQSALDMADSGLKVYMLTNDPCIGGNMVRLDKTFPTNDCSMCIVSPKLVTVGNHPNIEIITMADVVKFEGTPGRFRVTANKRPRYIDESKCTGCTECSVVCPVHLPDPQNEGMNERRAAFRMYPQAVPNWFAIDRDRTAPCKMTCPAHISVQGYVNLVGEGRFRDALDVIRARIPFPSICGRVCYHPCEEKCNRKDVDEPVAINQLKRFVSDLELEEAGVIGKFSGVKLADDPSKQPSKLKENEISPRAERVAIIGAGPAGLTAAADLAQLGFPATVFEKLPVAGGMLAVGVPEYRLPMKVIDYEVGRIRSLGVEIRLNTEIDKDKGIDWLFAQGYKAVYIAVGAHGGMKLGIRGESLPGVVSGIEFLRKAKLGEKMEIGRKVLVIGGGNVAIDTARTALRLGAGKVTLLCLENTNEMPAWDWEIEEARAEGVEIVNCWGPKAIVEKDGKAAGVEFRRCTCVFDEHGAFCPQYDESNTCVHEADLVLVAIGQRTNADFLNDAGVGVGRRGTVVAEAKTAATSREGVFAGGDCAAGPGMAIEAIASGKNAAVSIARYLNGEKLDAPRYEDELKETTPIDESKLKGAVRAPRQSGGAIPAEIRRGSFVEIEKPLTPEQAVAEAKRCLQCGPCSDCRMCESTCRLNAVDFGQKDRTLEFEVGSVVLAPGFETFDPERTTQYGYGVFGNVYTSIEFERLLSASGPTMGHIVRRSDAREPRNVAFIQCVGSRDASLGREYCSGVCCMYTAKESIIAKEHQPGLDCTVFCIDVRAQGKNFDRYYEMAKNTCGVRYVRGAISGIKELQQSKNLLLTFLDEDGKQKTEEFDMVVLAIGIEPTSTNKKLAEIFDVRLNKYGFCDTDPVNTVRTNRDGVYAAGAFQSPKDIPDSVTQAGSAACEALIDLASERGKCVSPVKYPPERNVSNEEPRIGVMVCRCGFNIGSVVDVPSVVEYAKTLPGVAFAEESLYTCSQDNIEHIVDVIKKHNLNRFVVSSCTVRTHLPLFEQAIRRAGLNKYLFEMANIREQDSWVHRDFPATATWKAMDLVAGAVAKVAGHRALEVSRSEVVQTALVIGGGPAGMTAALSIADQGIPVFLVEKDAQLGGNLRNIHYLPDGADPKKLLSDTIAKVEAHPKITVYKKHSIKEVSGHIGHFTTSLLAPENGNGAKPKNPELHHGICIVATGGNEVKPELPARNRPNVLTQSEFAEKIAANDPLVKNARNVVVIQCFGQRNEERPYCSKVCCQNAIDNLITLKDINPGANAYVLYRDIRSYGFKELKFLEARDKGVMFVRFKDGDDPKISLEGGAPRVSVNDDVIKRELIFEPDILVLSVPIEPSETSKALSEILKVTVDADGFFCEAHAKLRPVDFASEGIFLCGVAHSPKPLEENIAQAKAAAARAMTVLSNKFIEASGMTARVNQEICAACLTCVRVCPFGVPFVNEMNRAQIEDVECRGCGCCAAACPAKAIEIEHFRDDQITAAEDAIITSAIHKALSRK